MTELIKICPKILSWCVLRLGGVCLVRNDVEGGFIMCQGQTGKVPRFSPGKVTIFKHLAVFFRLSLPKICHSHPLKLTFLKSTRIELSPNKVLF